MSKSLQIYSERFAQEVLESFLRKRGRATAFYAELNEIPLDRFHELLQTSIRFNQKRWNMFKAAIKLVAKANNVAEDAADGAQTFNPVGIYLLDQAKEQKPAGSSKKQQKLF